MFPQRHCSGLYQLLQFPSAPAMPFPLPTPMDRSSTSSRSSKPKTELAPNCPRCASTNTKFCYYNNYSLSQPRYFCKACRRYWTKGGSLRKVPVGGGCRKNRRGKSGRHPQSDRHSFQGNSNSGSESVGDDDDQNSGSRDIDMALVFAKFLNQNVGSGEENFESEANNGSSNSSSNNLSNSLTPESVETENDAVTQPQKPSDPDPITDDCDALLLGGVHQEDQTVQNFVGEELCLSEIELEGLIDENVVQDVLWSDDATSITWQQPMMPMQSQKKLEYSVPLIEEAQFPINTSTMNLITDSWSTWNSLDFSTMD